MRPFLHAFIHALIQSMHGNIHTYMDLCHVISSYIYSIFNCYNDFVCYTSRWDKGYETCQLDELPHTCLTKPCKVFEYFFEGERKGRGRDNIVKLDVIAEGIMNAVAFWFDLHLDEEESLCSGKRNHSEDDEASLLQHM